MDKTTINQSTTKGGYWLGTIPHRDFTPFLMPGIKYIKGQLEIGEGGFTHWQVMVHTKGQQRLSWLKKNFGSTGHWEVSRSDAAEDYVWKEETSVAGTRFELGTKSLKRGAASDWDDIWDMAKQGRFEDIPKDVTIRCYSQIKSIAKDHMLPQAGTKKVIVYWGTTGTGKSHTAWEEAGLSAFPKDPLSKFWDGYQGHKNVVMEEFRGDIPVSHILRWTDKYPVIVDTKHGACVLAADSIWITSNLHPRGWYPMLDTATTDALLRRLDIRERSERYVEAMVETIEQ